ncbi:MAG: alcohol dehydrogenase catalytic domain-containing protein [Terracidiphilus sp.]|jgi:2-desacetyl-2-hydroxyethyl bacteriochlorophyllide A dehydrogenase
MRALLLTAPRQVAIRELARLRPAAGECEVAVTAAGICGSDLSGFLGRSRHRTPPLVMGHELVGRSPDGRRVVVNPLIGCGKCAACLSDAQNLCSDFRLLGMDGTSGCHAEFVAVPVSHVYEIPDHLTDARAVLTEPLANIVHLFRIAAPPPDFRLGIVGGGTMGSLALLMARRMGAREILVEDVNEARLEALRQMGATIAVSAGEGRRFAGQGLDLVLDACGTSEARQQAFDLCRPGGMVILLGMGHPRSEIDFAASIRKEHRVVMSFAYTPADFECALKLLMDGEIDLSPWTAEMPLEEGQKAFEQMTSSPGATLRMVLRVG